MGKLCVGTKSDLLACFEPVGSQVIASSVTCVVVDGPAIVHLLKPGTLNSFNEYANQVFVSYIGLLSHFNHAKHVVLAFMVTQKVAEIKELWIGFGSSNNFRYLPIHKIAATLGPSKTQVLPVCNALTG